jgi:hypothetical protein
VVDEHVDFVIDYDYATWRSQPRIVHSTEDHRNVADVRRDSEHMVGILWAIIVILFIIWLIGFFAVHLTGGLIHIALAVAVILLLVNLFSGRGARV